MRVACAGDGWSIDTRAGKPGEYFVHKALQLGVITKGSLSYLSSPCFSKNVLQSGVGIVH